MYKRSDHKQKKSLIRRNLLRIKKHGEKFFKGIMPKSYIYAQTRWCGYVVKPSVWLRCRKPYRSKYTPHQGYLESERRRQTRDG